MCLCIYVNVLVPAHEVMSVMATGDRFRPLRRSTVDSSVRIACRVKGACNGVMVGESWAGCSWLLCPTWGCRGHCSEYDLVIAWEFKPL